jgi:phage protein D
MASAIFHQVRSPQWSLTYQGIDITTVISPMVVSVSYTDRLSELSGEVTIVIEDSDQKWQSSWYPGLGDQIGFSLGYRGEGLLPCGDFQIDQIELSGPSDILTMRGMATFVTGVMRTRNSVGYENQTLLGIAQTIAAKYGLSVVSAPDVADLVFERVT